MRTFLCVLCVSMALLAQERASVAFSDPSKPGRLRVHLLNGGITIRGYEGKEVVIESKQRAPEERRGRRSSEAADTAGLRRIPQNAAGLSVEEEGNSMTISTTSHNHTVDLDIQVPMNTSLKLSSTNDGNIKVDRVRGEIEVNNTNGGVTMNNISGSVVAHALNGDLIVTMDEVTSGKAMSFTSFNGKVDVKLPATTKARLSMRTDNGEILSDFDIKLEPAGPQTKVEDSRGKGGRFKLQQDKAVYGTINGGGPDFIVKSFNGNLYIRKK